MPMSMRDASGGVLLLNTGRLSITSADVMAEDSMGALYRHFDVTLRDFMVAFFRYILTFSPNHSSTNRSNWKTMMGAP